jgi:hypothetical protein
LGSVQKGLLLGSVQKGLLLGSVQKGLLLGSVQKEFVLVQKELLLELLSVQKKAAPSPS